ncbi:MAG: hypothetical protein ACAH59_08815 [Pseudobdellovibrionaceae bacterium]
MKSLSEYTDLIEALRQSFVPQLDFHASPDLDTILDHPRLIVVMNHSTPLSWLPAITALSYEMVRGGYSSRVVRGVMDRWFYNNPLTKKLAEFITQLDRPQSFDELLNNFEQNHPHDMIIFPEGANTFFGDPNEIQEFRSNRFLELAIRSKTPLLLAVHKGSESWSFSLPVAKEWGNFLKPYSKFFSHKISHWQSVNLPVWPHRLEHFSMSCELYLPSLKEEDLSSDRDEKKIQLDREGQLVRKRMSELLRDLSQNHFLDSIQDKKTTEPFHDLTH